MNEQHPLWNSVSCLVVAVLAIVAFVRGAWELPLLAAAFIGWGAWVLWTQVLPALRSGRRIHASEKTRRTKEATLHPRQDETAARKAEEEMARTLLRYVNRRISDQLKAVNPNIRWEWEEKNPALLAVRGGIGRIRLYGIPDYCHADVDLNPDGTLTCALIKTVSEPETEDGRVLDPSEAQKADPQAWYSQDGQTVVKALVADLDSRGFSQLTIQEDGRVLVLPLEGGKEREVGFLKNFPIKEHWPNLTKILERDGYAAAVRENCIAVVW